ncbi:hypothetical protein [Enterococcus sp. AZ102]|uniref:hypothetical protein n=1 Tax=Enterococcus sp. AZ102 TaxID=2774865 RepID=UPI003F24CECE
MKTRSELIAEGLIDAKKWYEENYEIIKVYQETKKVDSSQQESTKNKNYTMSKIIA